MGILLPTIFTLVAVLSLVLKLPIIAPTVNWSTTIPYFNHLQDLSRNFSKLPANILDITEAEPECKMTTPQLLQYLGYPCETHYVITQDGYILTLHRIPYGIGGATSDPRKPVLLQHGLVSSSFDWLMNPANYSLGFILADQGFDVWLGNIRGNTYSTNHTTLNTSNADFWDFSYDDMAKYDVPAMIDYILTETANEKLYYVGHSMGTTMAFALLSTTSDYDDKIELFVAIAPVAEFGETNCLPIIALAPTANLLYTSLTTFGVNSLLDSNNETKLFGETVCKGPVIDAACLGLLVALSGPEGPQFNNSRLPIIFTHYPAGASVKTVVHYLQNYNSKIFRRFDYGAGNQQKYNQTTPPVYDVTKINVKMALIHGSGDALATLKDVQDLVPKVQRNLVEPAYLVTPYSHVDLIWAPLGVLYVPNKVVSLLKAN